MRPVHASFVVALLVALGCDKGTEPARTAPAASTSASLSAPSVPAARGRVVHYDLALTISEGASKSESAFSLDVAEGRAATVSLAKNVVIAANARSDVGTKVKAHLTMEGVVPKLELEAQISGVDAAGKVFRATPKGAAVTPFGKATTDIDATDRGRKIELRATPGAGADLGPDAKAEGGAVLDIVASHAGAGEPKTTPLTLTLAGDTPVVASKIETTPLKVVDGGVASPRQDTGTRVKAKGEARNGGMELDFDAELSDIEPSTPAARIRKITASGRAPVPYDKPTTLLTAEEDGQRYTITVTLHHPK
jgi:hypothetical protein